MPPRPLLLGLLVLTALRWVVAGASELTPAEALVWLGGRQAPLGFFDHGPLAAWLVRAGTTLAGDTALGVRFFAPLAILGASWLGWRLAASAFGDKTGGWFVTALQLTPLVNLGAVRALPGTFAFFFAVAAAWWLWQALHRASPWAWQWPAAGAAMGLALLASPSGAALFAGLVVLLTVPRRWRGRWRSPAPWLALACAAATAAPWLWWLRQLDWLPLASAWFAWVRAPAPLAFLQWLGLAVIAASPFLFAGLLWASVDGGLSALRSWQRYRDGGLSGDDPHDQKSGRVFLLSLAAPGGLWTLAHAALGHDAMDLAAFAGFAALMLLSARWIESPLPPTTHRLAQNATLLVAAAYSLLALHNDLARHLGLPWPYRLDPTASANGWREAAAQTAAASRALTTSPANASPGPASARPVFLIAETPALAAALDFYLPAGLPLPPPTTTRLRCHVPARLAAEDDFASWPGYAEEAGWTGFDALFVSEAAAPPALAVLNRQFRQLESLGRIEIRRGGRPLRSLSFFACRSWRGPAR